MKQVEGVGEELEAGGLGLGLAPAPPLRLPDEGLGTSLARARLSSGCRGWPMATTDKARATVQAGGTLALPLV